MNSIFLLIVIICLGVRSEVEAEQFCYAANGNISTLLEATTVIKCTELTDGCFILHNIEKKSFTTGCKQTNLQCSPTSLEGISANICCCDGNLCNNREFIRRCTKPQLYSNTTNLTNPYEGTEQWKNVTMKGTRRPWRPTNRPWWRTRGPWRPDNRTWWGTRGPWRPDNRTWWGTRGPLRPTDRPWWRTREPWRTNNHLLNMTNLTNPYEGTEQWKNFTTWETMRPWRLTNRSWWRTRGPWRPTNRPWWNTRGPWRPTDRPWWHTRRPWRLTNRPWLQTRGPWRPTGHPWSTRRPWRPTDQTWWRTKKPYYRPTLPRYISEKIESFSFKLGTNLKDLFTSLKYGEYKK